VVVADQEGFLEREGVAIDVTFTFDGGQLLAGGQVDVLNDGADSGLLAALAGKDVILVAPVAQLVTDGLVSTLDVKSVQDLAGKTVRTSGFGTDDYLARKFIEDNGLSPDEVDFLGIEDDGAAIAQLEQGEIAAGMFDQGFVLESQQTGKFNVLAEPSDLGSYPWNTIQTTRSFADDHPEAITGFIRAVVEAMHFIQDPANRQQVIDDVLATGEGLTEEDVTATYDAAQSFALYMFSPLTVKDVSPALDFLVFAGEDVEGIDLESLIDNSFYEEATA
jgi:ABC-type nitrate/sulfonate/bicarbonate transport system substrate-binding protein